MRILKIGLPGALVSKDSEISLGAEEVRVQLHRELEALKGELAESIRQRVAAYFPADYAVFVRMSFPTDAAAAITSFWIEDPSARWPAALFARRAWKLSIPILAHVVKETFQERFPSISLEIDGRSARVTALTPTRGWLDPGFIALVVAIASAIYWLALHGWLRQTLGRALGF